MPPSLGAYSSSVKAIWTKLSHFRLKWKVSTHRAVYISVRNSDQCHVPLKAPSGEKLMTWYSPTWLIQPTRAATPPSRDRQAKITDEASPGQTYSYFIYIFLVISHLYLKHFTKILLMYSSQHGKLPMEAFSIPK